MKSSPQESANNSSQGGGKKRKFASSASAGSEGANTTESDVLAMLGSTLQNMDDYEQGVLKTAELEQTPRLSGHCGFPPSLSSSLAPSGHAPSDVPHFQTLLTTVRQLLTQQPHNLSLLLQQQMLLNAIHITTQDFEACLRPREEVQQEQLRRQRFQRLSGAERSMLRTKSSTTASRGKEPLKSALKRTTEAQRENEEATATMRLEEIKQQRKAVNFVTPVAMAPRRRIGIQKRRTRNDSNDEEEVESEEELQRRKAQLRKLRQEREQRREKRRTKWKARNARSPKERNSQSSRATKGKTSDDEENEFELDAEISRNEVIEGDSEDAPERISLHQSSSRIAVSTESTSVFKTTCPLCLVEVRGTTQDRLDENLAVHMGACQASRPRMRRTCHPSRGTSRAAKSCTNDEMTTNVTTNVSDNDESAVANMEKDDEDYLVDSVSPRSEKRVPSRAPTSDGIRLGTSLDDFEEDDYEDRVDEWIQHGVDHMRVMKERDEAEAPPGEEIYDGGLVIPAWVNDNLFPYQRTGLQWMWELHRQQAGGIIGGTYIVTVILLSVEDSVVWPHRCDLCRSPGYQMKWD